MLKMAQADVFISGMDGLGIEIGERVLVGVAKLVRLHIGGCG